MSKRSEEMDADAHVSDDNVTVGVLGAVENVLGSEEWVKGEGERERSVLEVSVDDVVLVEAVNGIENRANDSHRVVLSKNCPLRGHGQRALRRWRVRKKGIILCTTQSPRKT